MDLCVMIEGQEDVTWPQWQAIAESCESNGIPALFRSDHYHSVAGRSGRGSLDAWSTVNALAATTENLRLGTLVSPTTFRHPAVLARMAATADQISDGRIETGIGAGWLESEHTAFGFPFGDARNRAELLREQVEIVRGLWSGGPFEFDGDHYRLKTEETLPTPVQDPMPLILGGNAGPKASALAARFASEYNTPFPSVEQAVERRRALDQACAEAERDPASLKFSAMIGTAIGHDSDEAAERARLITERTGNDPAPSWIRGDPEQALSQLRELAETGLDRVMLQLLLHEETDQIELIGRALAPQLR